MNGIARFGFAVVVLVAQCALGTVMAATASLDEYLYPATIPPAIPARFVYRSESSIIRERGSGFLRVSEGFYDIRDRDYTVEFSLGERRESAPVGMAMFYDYDLPEVHFVNYASNSESGLSSNSDCFFPKISLLSAQTRITALNSAYACKPFGALLTGAKHAYLARYAAPTVVAVEDGNLIEAVQVVVERDGYRWGDYLFGYHLGLIRFNDAAMTNNFFSVPQLAVTSLPPPAVEGTVVEYRNTQDFPQSPGGHFFYSSDPAEQASVDAGQAGKFERTGRSFNAGGYLPVCRFYGSVSPGPNSHFFSAMPEECALLKSLQRTYIAPSTEPQWNSEGNGFYTVAPLTDAQGQKTCLAGTQPVHRAYNNAFPVSGPRNPWDSNHRFSTQRADIDELVQRYGWRDEGVVFCAPLSASSASQ